MIDNSLGDADYYAPQDYIGIGKRIVVILIDTVVLALIGFGLWLPFAAMIMAEVLQSDPSGVFWLMYLFLIWVYLAPIKGSLGTIGFRLLGIKLVSAKGGRPSLIIMTMRIAFDHVSAQVTVA